MATTQFAFSAAPIRKIKEVQFGILSPEEIVRPPFVPEFYLVANRSCALTQKAYSVAKIEFPEVMDEATQRPKEGGLQDPRMGTIDRNFKCATCGEGMAECPGHFGHIELARPVFHPGKPARPSLFLRRFLIHCAGFLIKVKKILECICVNCGKLKADIVSVAHP